VTLRPKTKPGTPLPALLDEVAAATAAEHPVTCQCAACVKEACATFEAKQAEEPTPMKRCCWVPAPAFFNLNMAFVAVDKAFGGHYGCYLVGSSLRKRDYRDVDVRLIMSDDEFERLFPGGANRPDMNPLWALLCSSISLFLQTHTGLPIDFQIQQQTACNAEFSRANGHPRHPLGVFLNPTPRDYAADVADKVGKDT